MKHTDTKHCVYLGLGTNIGDRTAHLKKAIDYINRLVGDITLQSSVYETQAWGMTNQADFYNMVVQVRTYLNPSNTLDTVLFIEKIMGRTRTQKWHSRIIDIDILFFDNDIIQQNNLSIPHPYVSKRKFVLMPLTEIAQDYLHPVLEESIASILEKCEDNLECRLLDITL